MNIIIKFFSWICLASIVLGCSSTDRESELDEFLTVLRSNNSDILEKINTIPAQVSWEVEMREEIDKFHKDVNSFIDSVDTIEPQILKSRVSKFIDRTFKRYNIRYPVNLDLVGSSPEILKIQLASIEGGYLRDSDIFYKEGFVRFDSISTIIVPDKYSYERDEQITGFIAFAAYTNNIDQFNSAIVKLNNKSVPLNKGRAYFNLSPAELGLSPEQDNLELSGQIILDNFSYSSKVSVLIRD